MSHSKLLQRILAGTLVTVLLVGCGANTAVLNGTLITWEDDDTISNRHLALCQIIGDISNSPGDCILTGLSATSNEQGQFQIGEITEGRYFILYDTGLSDFKAGFEQWTGKTLELSNVEWVASEYCGTTLDKMTIHLLKGMSIRRDHLVSAIRDLYVCNSPFVLALDPNKDQNTPLVIDVQGPAAEIQIRVRNFEPNNEQK